MRQVSRKRSARFISRMADRLSHESQIPLKDVIEELEKKVIVQVLSEVEGNQKDAAKILGMKYTTLNEKLKRYGIRIKRVSMILFSGLALYFSLSLSAQTNGDAVKKTRSALERAVFLRESISSPGANSQRNKDALLSSAVSPASPE